MLPQQGDKFSKNVTGLKRSTVKHCNGDMKVDKQLSDKQLLGMGRYEKYEHRDVANAKPYRIRDAF